MMNRRSVLKLGAASVAGAVVNLPAPALGPAPPDFHAPLLRAVFDERFEEALEFAGELHRRGVAALPVGRDVAQLWYRDLQVCLGKAPLPTAGLTDRATLFCLEEMARDVGMGVRYRVDHMIDPSGYVQHDAVGPARIVAATRRLMPGSGFGRAMAVIASRFELAEPKDAAALKRTGPFSPENKIALVSWLIA